MQMAPLDISKSDRILITNLLQDDARSFDVMVDNSTDWFEKGKLRRMADDRRELSDRIVTSITEAEKTAKIV